MMATEAGTAVSVWTANRQCSELVTGDSKIE